MKKLFVFVRSSKYFPSSPPPPSFISQPVVLSLRVTFDSLQPSRASSPKMTATKDYSALPLQKYACIAGYGAIHGSPRAPLFLHFHFSSHFLLFAPFSRKEPLSCGGERGIWDNREIMLSAVLNVGDQSLPFLKAQVRKCIKFVDHLCASTLRRRLVDS